MLNQSNPFSLTALNEHHGDNKNTQGTGDNNREILMEAHSKLAQDWPFRGMGVPENVEIKCHRFKKIIFLKKKKKISVCRRRHDIKHKDIQHYYTRHYANQQN